ncbi:enoyl-CoA hydratase/isomerase family protein [soil metagenome]
MVLDRPDRLNAQTPHTWAALHEIGAGLPDAVRLVVVRAEGGSFSAGLDRAMFTVEGLPGQPGIGALAAMPTDEADAVIRGYQEGFRWLRRADIVSIAVVRGHAVGAGFQLALACDLRVLAEDAQLCMAETSLGIVPDLTGTWPLVEAVGYSRALEICATGRRVGAQEAARLGLATVVVPVADLESATAALVAALLAAPADAVSETKALLRGAVGRDRDEQETAERAAQLRRLRAMAAGTP